MFSYIKGIVTEIKPEYITIENQGLGYLIKTPNPYVFKLNEESKIFIHHYVREDIFDYYGFRSQEQKDMFIKLISVKGIGPKGALAILASGSVKQIIEAIETGNNKYLQKFPGIGPKASMQIILDLKGKINFEDDGLITLSKADEVSDALRALGYSKSEIKKVLTKIKDEDLDVESLLKKALQLLVR